MELSWSLPSGNFSLSEGKLSSSSCNDGEFAPIGHKEQEIVDVGEQNGNQENNVENEDLGISSGNHKRRKKESDVWKEMDPFVKNGEKWAKCKHCKKEYRAVSTQGTTRLKRHLESKSCRSKRKHGGGDADKSMKTAIDVTSPDVFKQKSVADLVNMFWEDGTPSELNARKIEILRVYKEEKEKLSEFLNNLSCRFTLRIEGFDDLYFLTVHYIDDSWEPRWKIISCLKTTGFGYANLVAALKESCLDLKIDGNIFSILCSRQSYTDDWDNYDDVIGETSSWLSERASLPFGGSLFVFGDYLESLTSYCEEWDSCLRLDRCLDYVGKTASKRHKFEIAVDKVNSMGKKFLTSDIIDYGHTYVMEDFLDILEHKEAFCELEHTDPEFKSINLTKEEWDDAILTSEHFKEFLSSVASLCDSEYATPNLYFPKFCDVYMKLLPRQRIEGYRFGENTSHHPASIRKNIFDRCWRVMVITVVLDPRFKMEIVQLWYKKIYGEDADSYLKKIEDDFIYVYNEYASRGSTSSISYLDAMGRPHTSSQGISSKSELDRYLNDDPKCPPYENLDILAWWRVHTEIYPTLARMARDFLAVPFPFSIPHSIIYCDMIDWTEENWDDDVRAAYVCLTNWLKLLE